MGDKKIDITSTAIEKALDLAKEFLQKLIGPTVEEFGLLMSDNVKFLRFKNQIKILNRAQKYVEQKNLETKILPLKVLVPLLENASLEEDEILQDKWAHLLASLSTTPEEGLEARLVKTLANLSAQEVKMLDFIYSAFILRRRLIFDKQLSLSWTNIKSETQISNDSVVISFVEIKEKFKLSADFIEIHLDNLEALGLLKYENPEIEIDDNSTQPEFNKNEKGEQYIDFDLDVSASLNKSNDVYLTPYGLYFIKRCKMENL